MSVRLFISHAHDEKDLALAWKELVGNTSSGLIEVWLSSDANPNGGMTLGKEWRDTIYERLANATHALAIVSPSSINRPWVMWECGVASGVDKERKLVPIVYGMPVGDLSGPLSSYQAYSGEDRERVVEVCERLAHEASMQPNTAHWGSILEEYEARVAVHRPRKPLQPAVYDVWLGRIERLIEEGRVKELTPLMARFYEAIGEKRAVDMRIHDRLSEVYLRHQQFREALSEVDLALALLPDDLVLIHRKGLILMELSNLNDVRQLLDEAFKRFPDAATWSELAGLEGRLHRELFRAHPTDEGLRERAIDAYRRAFEADPRQYYPGGQAIALALQAGDQTTVDALLPRVRELCEGACAEPTASYWADFTLGELYLVEGDLRQAEVSYRRGMSRTPPPGPRERSSALNGVLRTGTARRLDTSAIANLLQGDAA